MITTPIKNKIKLHGFFKIKFYLFWVVVCERKRRAQLQISYSRGTTFWHTSSYLLQNHNGICVYPNKSPISTNDTTWYVPYLIFYQQNPPPKTFYINPTLDLWYGIVKREIVSHTN
jgi:hypothetical protein